MLLVRLTALIVLVLSGPLLAKTDNEATIVKFYGKVRLFKEPRKTKKGKGPFVKVGEFITSSERLKEELSLNLMKEFKLVIEPRRSLYIPMEIR